ncbi:SRPBCC family protein [Candidatus Cyanaurora vandensis]|uniref:SRPBCC family protein n=1 Tax=Candidatus Cyanaurora vandensis TaxID=2714958 RepID=UPI0025796F32|nr:SRPBCC family protein [Candidatus Cyanaurora vandensis]
MFSHTLKTSASPEAIWAIWADVENWSAWDTELRNAHLEGSFVLGARGKLTAKTGSVSTFTISQLNLKQSYTFTCQLPFCRLNVYRYLSDRTNGTYFTHEISFEGPLAFLFSRILGRQFQAVLPSVMENLKQLAETRNPTS